MTCTHNFHFIELESENEKYTEPLEPGKDIIKVRLRNPRYAIFVCDLCGLIKKVEVQ